MSIRLFAITIILLYTIQTDVFSNSFEKFTSEEKLLLKYKNEIIKAAGQLSISPRIIASIIYAEQKLNVKAGENILDYVFAKSGYNSSMGVAQIKINTALWIEEQLNNPESQFYLGSKIQAIINQSRSRGEIIDKLDNPEINIFYAACYMAMIIKLWQPVLDMMDSGNNRAGIIATIYSIGIRDAENRIRQPHLDAKMNDLGRTAQKFYQSFSLRIF